jgi:hypothetical protein
VLSIAVLAGCERAELVGEGEHGRTEPLIVEGRPLVSIRKQLTVGPYRATEFQWSRIEIEEDEEGFRTADEVVSYRLLGDGLEWSAWYEQHLGPVPQELKRKFDIQMIEGALLHGHLDSPAGRRFTFWVEHVGGYKGFEPPTRGELIGSDGTVFGLEEHFDLANDGHETFLYEDYGVIVRAESGQAVAALEVVSNGRI